MGHSQKAWKTLLQSIFPAFYSSNCYFFPPLSPPTFISTMNFFQLALINDLTSQRKNTPTHLSRKFDERKMIFGFQKKNVAKCSALHFRGTHRSWCQGVWPEVSQQTSGPVAAAERMSWSDRIETPHQKARPLLTIVLSLATNNLRNCDYQISSKFSNMRKLNSQSKNSWIILSVGLA